MNQSPTDTISRLAVTVKTDDGLDAPLDPVFGRAARFLVVNPNNGSIEADLGNPFIAENQGAGTGVAGLLKDQNIDAVISGRFGPKAYQALIAFGISMWNAPEGITARDALVRLARGELTKMEIKRY